MLDVKMIDAKIQQFSIELEQVREAVARMEAWMKKVSSQEVGKIRTDHRYIVRVDGVCGGRPVIEGTRLSVKLIVGWSRMGMAPEEIAAQYPYVSVAQIVDALAYYEDHTEEIDAEFAEEQRYLEAELPRIQAMVTEQCERVT